MARIHRLHKLDCSRAFFRASTSAKALELCAWQIEMAAFNVATRYCVCGATSSGLFRDRTTRNSVHAGVGQNWHGAGAPLGRWPGGGALRRMLDGLMLSRNNQPARVAAQRGEVSEDGEAPHVAAGLRRAPPTDTGIASPHSVAHHHSGVCWMQQS